MIKHYQEKILETNIACDNCGLVFSIYGVFSNCPDCGRLNAKVIFEKIEL
jgi:Zn finger protein HypA/HybF involved in hydrogenase expression